MIPKFITRATLLSLMPASETHVVRLILHDAPNGSRYLLRCRSRQYSFERDQTVGRHILDVPLSLYMENATAARWKDNPSIAEDIRTAGRAVTLHVLPISEAASVAEASRLPASDSSLPELKRLLMALDAPEQVQECIDAIEAGLPVEDVRTFVDNIIASLENPAGDENLPPPPADNVPPAKEAAPGQIPMEATPETSAADPNEQETTPVETPAETVVETPAAPEPVPAPKASRKLPAARRTNKK